MNNQVSFFEIFPWQRLLSFWLSIVVACLVMACQQQPLEIRQTDVLVIGGGSSGVAAGIQAARSGAAVIIAEETPWLGGMLTSAGVSAIDGNHKLPSGLWGEFREKIYEHYGGASAVATGWVSNTQFEPHIGNKAWNELADEQAALTRLHGLQLVTVLKEGKKVIGAVFSKNDGTQIQVNAKVTIDATELGDAIAMAGAEFFQGQDPQSLTGEAAAPTVGNDYVQDLTYVAILKDYGKGVDKTIPKPKNYDPSQFNCLCADVCDQPGDGPIACDKMLQYGKLPNEKYMINWPNDGNDYYVNALEMTPAEREIAYKQAKEHTLSMVYFIQTVLGYAHLGLAEDEFETPDRLPYIPYHRESRRVAGEMFLTLESLEDPYRDPTRPLFQYAIAVGDYPLDHHHKKNPLAVQVDFPAIPSFSIPFGALLPRNIEGMLACEKNISVSHFVNGASRLQPCVILIGQAAGATAALAVKAGIEPKAVNVRELQQQLLDANCWLLPFIDVSPASPYFQSLQKLGVSSLLKGHGVPYQWANQTWIYPDSVVSYGELINTLEKCTGRSVSPEKMPRDLAGTVKVKEAILLIWKWATDAPATRTPSNRDYQLSYAHFESNGWLELWKAGDADQEKELTRKDLAFFIDQAFDPFNQLAVPVPRKILPD